MRRDQTQQSKSDPDSRFYRKGQTVDIPNYEK
jgi:hypothetical protein